MLQEMVTRKSIPGNCEKKIASFIEELIAARSEWKSSYPDFAALVWESYVDAISTTGSYYLSIDELFLVCQLAHTNVIVYKQGAAGLERSGDWRKGGPTASVKLQCNEFGRGHFERVMLLEDVRRLDAEVAAEARAAQEAARAIEREQAAFSREDSLSRERRRLEACTFCREWESMEAADTESEAFRRDLEGKATPGWLSVHAWRECLAMATEDASSEFLRDGAKTPAGNNDDEKS